MNSIWLEHSEYPGYLFNPEGNCLSLKGRDPLILKNMVNTNTYMIWKLNGIKKSCHRIIAEIFCKKPSDNKSLQVNHIDGNKQNNNYKNLEWVTPSENRRHSIDVLGRDFKAISGESNYGSKLTEKDINKIKEMLKSGMKQREVAAIYGVSRPHISQIKNNNRWKHLTRK